MRPKQLIQILKRCYDHRRPAFIRGKPGVGKSTIVREFADNNNLQFIDFRLTYCDPVDLRGLPKISGDKTEWLTPAVFPTKGSGILFFDELTSASPAVQAACYQITHDKKLAEYELPEGWVVFAAGNSQSDRAVANRMSSALVSRFVNLDLEVNIDDWSEYAMQKDFAQEVIAYNRFKGGAALYTFNPETWVQDKPYACPRTWEYLSEMMSDGVEVPFELAAGLVGEGEATSFMAFCKVYLDLPNLDGILLDPDKAAIPDNPGAQYAVITGLARKAGKQNLGQVLKYLARMPKEMEVCCIRDAYNITNDIVNSKAFTEYCLKNQSIFSGGNE